MSDEWNSNPGSTAAGWEANADLVDARLQPVTDWLIERSGVRAGDIVLDLAAGPGGVGHRAAQLVGSGGRVLSTDLAPAMVDAARRIGAEHGLTNVEYRVVDAQAMDLDDDLVDVVVCRSGFMLMPNPIEALRETRRVLKPGGNLAFSVFGAPDQNPFPHVPQTVLVELGHLLPPQQGAPGVFAMSDTARIRTALLESGFDVAAIEAIDLAGSFPDAEFIVERVFEMNPQVSEVHRRLDSDGQEELRQAMMTGFAAFRQVDGTYELPTQMWGVHAH